MEVPPRKSKGARPWCAPRWFLIAASSLIAKGIMRSSTWKLKPGKFRLETRRNIFFLAERIINIGTIYQGMWWILPTPEGFK